MAHAFIIEEEFVGDDNVALILGTTFFMGRIYTIRKVTARKTGANIFASNVNDPERFGVVEFDHNGKVISTEEMSETPKSSFEVTGLYCYYIRVVDTAKGIQPSKRGELQITAVNEAYRKLYELPVELLGCGFCMVRYGEPGSPC